MVFNLFTHFNHYGRRPTNPEKMMIMLMQKIRYKKGKVKKVGLYYNKGLYRPIDHTGDFYANCVFGPFNDGGRKIGPYEMDIAFPEWKVDIEIDGIFHDAPDARERDKVRDYLLKSIGWTVVRIPQEAIYRIFVPELNKKGTRYV